MIVEEHDIFGDGVNVAAWLEALADPGGICVSRVVRDQVRDKLDYTFEDLGKQQVKNIARPVRVYRAVDRAAHIEQPGPASPPPLPLPDKPSIAVLPFQNMSSDPEQEFFADGIAEDVVTALSRYPSLFVIARNSCFTYKGRAVDVKQIGRELGVRYVLEGSLRKAGNRIRVTAQLVEAETGNHVWAERYDRDLSDICAVQEEISQAVTISVAPAIARSELQRATPAGAATCASLAGLALPDTTITAAQSVPDGTYTAPDGGVYFNLPAFCRIAATLTPTSDSDIYIEVWMPFSTWNGRYLGLGNGGFGGIFLYDVLARYLPLNYAVAQTDMGTSPGAPSSFGLVLSGHPEKQIDYATRSTNLMTVRAKEIIKAFYGEPPKFSYFSGCSGGGGSAVHEALQFPRDYDGIIAGAPFMNVTHRSAHDLWNFQAFNGPATITLDQATAITAAVVKRCAGKDGGLSSDNFLTDPRDCHWDPSALQCTGGSANAPTCLTAPQVAGVRKFYQGPINPRTGERIYAGNARGSENNSGFPAAFATLGQQAALKWGLGNDFDFSTFDFDHDMDMVDEHMDIVGEPLAAILNANTADLEEFKSHGGKLILAHGFADPRSPTLNTVAYYERLIAGQTREGKHDEEERKEALHRTQEFARLFLFPGVGHCRDGAGPDSAKGDLALGLTEKIARIALDPLVQWIEHCTAPDQIIAYHVSGSVQDFSRPVCPYPALPRYSGVGDTTKASSFICAADYDHDNNQPPAPKYLNDGDNYPIIPIDDGGRRHDHDNR